MIFEAEPHSEHKRLFTMLALAYDVKMKFGFVIVVCNGNFNQLRYLQRALLMMGESAPPLVFLERFKVVADT